MSRRVAVLSPHLDDAVLSCWSVLAGPDDVTVVTVFAGDPPAGPPAPWDRITGAADPSERMRARREEDRAALALAGRAPVHLGLVEAQYRDAHPALGAIAAAIAPHVEGAEAVYAPAGIKAHADHVLVREAALALSAAPVSLYAELPYATRFGWPGAVAGVDVEAFWAGYLDGLEAGEPSLRRLSVQQQEAKLAAMRTYASQFEALDGGPQRRLSHPDLLAHELVWPLCRPR